MIRYIYLQIILLVSAFSVAQTNTENYTVETIYREGRNPSGSYIPNPGDFITATYYDGMGRPIQQIQQKASALSELNIIIHTEYEKNIGKTREYLPIPTNESNIGYKTDARQSTFDYYNAMGGIPNPYSENRMEAAPNARALETGAPGTDWMINTAVLETDRHTVRYSYGLNTATEVKKFDVTSSWNASRELYTNTVTQNGNCLANSLKKTVAKNENWKAADGKNNTTEEFVGVDGKTVLKRTYNDGLAHDTYYVYDFYGNLVYVIPPLANGSVAGTNLNDLCYQYLYDDKNRLVEKKLPQKGWEFIVYDKADRIVMTGPANNPFNASSAPGWIVTKYDNMGRTLYTGYYSGHTVTSTNRKTIKTSIYAQTDNNEAKTDSNTTIDGVATRYTNTKFPAAFNLLTVNYYDDYQFPNAPSTLHVVQGVTTVAAVKGLATGSWTRVITTDAERKADVSYTLYNNKYQPLRTYTASYLNGYIQTDNVLTFRGIPTKTITTQKKDATATALTVTNNYTYDNRERLKTHTQQINGGTARLIAENTYDELGKLTYKKVGNTSASPLQNVYYNYNVRGWLTQMNQIENTIGLSNKLFNYAVNYNAAFDGDTSKPQYNGNISSVSWRTLTDNEIRGYGFDYDHLNRLNYGSHLTSEGNYRYRTFNRDGQYAEDLTYDKNGNITTLKRYGQEENGQPIEWDDLTYTYTGNQLQTVTDATNSPAGFNDGNKTSADYTYDVFGNLKTDKNKGITNITYNHLNLPVEITFATGKIAYTYDATGTKVKKVVQPNSGVAQTTDYLYGFQYLNGALQFFPHAEGYVKPNGTNSYLYVYQYKDHLGNVRLSYADCDGNGTINPATEILEENNYYPFGLQHQGYNDIANSCRSEEAEAYKYNGKEYEDNFGLNMYEYGARNYDPAVGRFFNIDNYAEKFSDMTTYQYAGNNPVYFIDKNGEYIYVYDEGTTYKFDSGKLYAKGEDGNWGEHTPKAGSFLEQIFTELKSMYEFTTGGGAGGNGGSFSNSKLNYFNNSSNNVTLFDLAKIPPIVQKRLDMTNDTLSETSTILLGSWAWVGIDMILGNYDYFGTNNRMNHTLLSQVIIHELGHAFLRIHNNRNNSNLGENAWIAPSRESEIFASHIENRFLSERNLPLRSNYFPPSEVNAFFKSSLMFNLNPMQSDSAIKNLQILNTFRKSLQTVPNTGFIFK